MEGLPPAPMYCAHFDGASCTMWRTIDVDDTESCEWHTCHLGSECPAPERAAGEGQGGGP